MRSEARLLPQSEARKQLEFLAKKLTLAAWRIENIDASKKRR